MGKRTKKRMQTTEAIEPDLFAEEFFSAPPPAPVIHEVWDEPEAAPQIAPDKRRAMIATLVIFSVLASVVGGYVVYSKLIMPTPIELSASAATYTMPTAYVAAPALAVAAPVIAAPPVVAEPVVAAPPVVAEPVVAAPPVVAEAVVAAPPVVAEAVRAATVKREPRVAAPRVATAAATTTPDDSYGARAMRELNAGRPQQAKLIAQQAVSANPERADGWIVLGAANDALGDHIAAKAAYAACTARAFGPRVATCRALDR